MTTVCVVGSLHYDILVTGGGRPRKGETLVAEAWAWKCGGKGGNQAIEAARHGASASFVGAVGGDTFGDALLARLVDAGVDISEVERIARVGSGMSVAIFDSDGDYGAVIVPGANWLIRDEAIDASHLLGACAVLLLQNETRPETNLRAANRARAVGARIILNAAPAQQLPGDLAALLDLIVVNEIEAEMMSGIGTVSDMASATKAAGALLKFAPAVVVTLGARGLLLSVRNGPGIFVPGHSVAVASTHGAGDAFIGALGARLSQGADLADAARYANAAAAIVVATPEDARRKLTPAHVASMLD